MASVKRFPGTQYWYGCFTLPDGRRVQRSTKETSRKAAQSKADTWERLSRGHANARQMHAVLSEIYRAAHQTELPHSTAKKFFESWLARRKRETKPSTYSSIRELRRNASSRFWDRGPTGRSVRFRAKT